MEVAHSLEARKTDAQRKSALCRLSQPLHVMAYLTGTQHYHFGLFSDDEGDPRDGSLADALESMATHALRQLDGAANVLDVGCAMGGTSRLFASSGLRVVGIDPRTDAIEYARVSANGASGSVEYASEGLSEFATGAIPRVSTFDGIVLLEVLQYFPDLASLFSACRELLRPGGLVVVHDVVKIPDVAWECVPYHRCGEVPRVAKRIGFDVLQHEDVSARTLPTLPRLAAELRARRGEIASWFLPERDAVELDVDELVAQVELLQRGFADGDLAYETVVLRRA